MTQVIAIAWLVLLCVAPAWAQVSVKVAAKGADSDPDPEVIREVTASSKGLIVLKTKLRYTTLVILPDTDEVMDVVCGDSANWVISTTRNIVHVKPAVAGGETNLNLVTATGAVYSFLMREVGKGAPDLKIYVRADETAAPPQRKWIALAEYEALQAQLVTARAQVDTERQRAEERVAAARKQAQADLKCDYAPVPNVKPFFVESICRSSEFTYIRTAAKELPALYELLDDKAALLNFQVEQGLYIVPKVLDKGYLAIGKQRLPFALKTAAGN